METKTLTQEVFPNATPHEVFEAYRDDKQHAELTGLPATMDENREVASLLAASNSPAPFSQSRRTAKSSDSAAAPNGPPGTSHNSR